MTGLEVDSGLSDDEDLRAALAGLSQLTAGTHSIESLLTSVAEFAHRAIPGADGAGVTMLTAGRPDVIVLSTPFVGRVDDIQYGLGEGPCITAAAEGRTVRSAQLDSDQQWPVFGPRAGALGVHSVLSLPLLLAGQPTALGAINVYALRFDAFTDLAAEAGEKFAAAAAIAVHNARLLTSIQQLVGHLQSAVSNKALIDQAVGVLCESEQLDIQRGEARLQEISGQLDLALAEAARHVINLAATRGREQRGEM